MALTSCLPVRAVLLQYGILWKSPALFASAKASSAVSLSGVGKRKSEVLPQIMHDLLKGNIAKDGLPLSADCLIHQQHEDIPPYLQQACR